MKKIVLQQCVTSDKYKLYNFEDDIFSDEMEKDEMWYFMYRICKTAGPLLLLVRLGDLKTVTLSKLLGRLHVYHLGYIF